jgi:flagella basal body P-ring formation protein FlgA
MQGPVRWNVSLPVTVKVYARALVAATGLQAGATLTDKDLVLAEVDVAAAPGAAVFQAQAVLGRQLARNLAPGEAVRQTDLRARQYFAAGDTVRLTAAGGGFQVQSEGQAMNPGFEGQPVRVRTESGRIVSGTPVGEREVEVML